MTTTRDVPDPADPNEVYALGASRGESERLQRQADELAPESSALLDRVGLGPGGRAIDLGCGPAGILHLLHARVQPGGSVVGLDADPEHVKMAGEFVRARGLEGTQVVLGDARDTGLPDGEFDLVHGRTLLVTVPEPEPILAEMVRLARPGGWVAGLEPDTEGGICYPPHPALARLGEIFQTAFRRNGADPFIGRRVPSLYRAAGLVDVGVEARATVYPPGHSRRTILVDLVRAIRPQIVALGLETEAELDELDLTARQHLADPDTLVLPHLSFLVWGRRPG